MPGKLGTLHIHEETGIKIVKAHHRSLHSSGYLYEVYERVEGPARDHMDYEVDPYTYDKLDIAGWTMKEAKQVVQPLIDELKEKQRLIRARNWQIENPGR